MTAPDYPFAATAEVASRDELVDVLAERGGEPVRLLGGGSAQHRLPPPRRAPTLVRLAGLSGIQRLEPGDLTCSVGAGLPRDALDAALAEHDLWLPCAGTGTLGGMFAADLHAPAAPGAFSPRTLLLGLEGVLAEGRRFKAGARVVKSVAGYDLQKLFVGSRGRLFAATLLHLKLRPRPRAVLSFGRTALGLDEALALWHAVRGLRSPALEVWLHRGAGGFAVRGTLAGHPRHIESTRRELEVEEGADAGPRHLQASAPEEIVQGLLRPSRAPDLLARLPGSAEVLLGGTGQFEARLQPAQTDAFAAGCAEVGAVCEVRCGAPDRRGRATPGDPVAGRLAAELKRALDPRDVLQ